MKYPATITPCGNDGFGVTFRDIPEAITQGETLEQAIEMAEDALATAIEFYFEDDKPVPLPSTPKDGEFSVSLEPSVWTKVLLLNAMLETHTSQAELAKRLKVSRQQVTRIVDLEHTTKLDTLGKAFNALGKQLNISMA